MTEDDTQISQARNRKYVLHTAYNSDDMIRVAQ